MQTHFSKTLGTLRSGLPTYRQGMMIVVIPVVCLATSLVLSVWLRQETIATRRLAPVEEPQSRVDHDQTQDAITIALWSVLGGGLLSALAAVYLFQHLHQELHDRQTQLAERTALLDAIATHAVDGIITLNAQRQIQTVNTAAATMFEYEPGEAIGKDVKALFTEIAAPKTSEEDQALADDAVMQSGQHQKAVGRQKTGALFPVELSIGSISSDRQIVIVRDVTNQERLKTELQAQADELAHTTASLIAMRAALQAAYIACCDLKAPLHAIIHLSRWIEADLDERVAHDTQNQMNLLRERVHRMEGLVDTILQYSESGAT